MILRKLNWIWEQDRVNAKRHADNTSSNNMVYCNVAICGCIALWPTEAVKTDIQHLFLLLDGYLTK